ncbi:MAG: Xaa-Pro peptidase family protein [Spirochaetales bacterium]
MKNSPVPLPLNYSSRRQCIWKEMRRQGIQVLLIEDAEGRRDPSLRYLSGHPQDALLFLHAEGRSVLVPWDVPLAEQFAQVEEILPYNQFQRNPAIAVPEILKHWGVSSNEPISIEVGPQHPHLSFIELQKALEKDFPRASLVCRREGVYSYLLEVRMIKTPEEISLLKKAAQITDELLLALESYLQAEDDLSETDLALFIETEARKRGAEGTSFETLAAGPERSFAIHPYPTFGPNSFKTTSKAGLSILDFGIRYEGYSSDVTFTLARGPLTDRMELLIQLVEEGYKKALSLCQPGSPTWEIAQEVQTYFNQKGFSMPHALGHGIGLAVHEYPFFRPKEQGGAILAPGMVLTLEPGLYEPGTGGVRLENDVLITESGHKVLTHSRIQKLPGPLSQ